VVEPGRQSDRDKTAYGHGIDRLGVRSLSRLLAAREPVDAGRVARVEADEAGSDQVPILMDVEVRMRSSLRT